jgi:predicted alpha/beta-hydrolase family hydrolase
MQAKAETPLLLLAPGAGAPSSSGWMRGWADRLSTLGRVVSFDYRYRREGRRTPDRLPALVATIKRRAPAPRAPGSESTQGPR